MTGPIPILVTTLLVTGAFGAEARPSTRFTAPSSLPKLTVVSTFAGSSAVQGDDLAAKVKAALKADPGIDAAGDAVTVTTAGGVVTLEGTADSVQMRAKIGECALKVDGVTKLTNKLKLPKK